MNNIINVVQEVVGGETIQTVNARDLHQYLGSGIRFSDWIKKRIEKYDFIDGVDFTKHALDAGVKMSSDVGTLKNVAVESMGYESFGQQGRIEYAISISMAKELAMVENNAQGKIARKYFLDCEKRLNNTSKGIVLDNPMHLRTALLAYTEKVITLENIVASQVLLMEQQAPAVDFVKSFVERGLNSCLTDAWKGLGIKPILFNKQLVKDGILFKRVGSNKNNAKQDQINAGHFVIRLSQYTPQTLVTPKGLLFIAKKYKEYISANKC